MSDIRQVSRVKLKKKLLSRFIIIAAVSVFLTAVFSTAAFWCVFSEQENENLKAYTQVLADSYEVDKSLLTAEKHSQDSIRITLISPDGKVIFDNSLNIDEAEMGSHSDRPEVIEAFKSGFGMSNRTSATLNSVTYYCAVRTSDGNVLRTAESFSSMIGLFVSIVPAIVLITAGVFIVCLIMSKRSAKKIISPIENMTKAPDTSVYEELEPLAQTISSQQLEINRQVRRLQTEKDKINTLIQNMSEGFLLLDTDRKVLMSNGSAAKFLGTDKEDILDKNILVYTRSETVVECVDSALEGEGKSGDITLNGRVLQFITNPVFSGKKQNGVICLIIDVSAKKKAEKMRREFTANVTHELKTPLTSISGYAEIIASGLARPDDVQGFAAKIQKESGRLLSLIGDIMKLSQLDENASDEDFTNVDVSVVASEVAEDLRSNAEKSGITIMTEVTPRAVIQGSRSKLYELIYNLCDNAIRYNKPDGSVVISTKIEDGHTILKVSDTGIGIPEKHQSRIFERFYRVDKSRSKETGGTGLGLAIVKHIAELHGGKVLVESGDSGTTFSVVF